MTDLQARLNHIGSALERIIKQQPAPVQPISFNIETKNSSVDTSVVKGSTFIAELETGSAKSIPVLLRIYNNTTGFLPLPSQVVFCQAETSWEEIHLLLKRCIGASNTSSEKNLFTLVNVELLSFDIQLQLVKEITRMEDSTIAKHMLAVVCRGGKFHHIFDQFPHLTHRISGFSDAEMMTCFRNRWPEVEFLTSSLPGLGKTEYVKNKASGDNFGVRTMTVSGPMTKEELVKHLREHSVQPYEIFHLDVASMSDPSILDCFLFETIVTGMAVQGRICLEFQLQIS